MSATSHVTSKDVTRIAYQLQGKGPPVLFVDGPFCYGGFGPMLKLAPLLDDRRGQGESGDTRPHAVQREVEDLRALLAPKALARALEAFLGA